MTDRELDALVVEHVMVCGSRGLKVCRTLDELRAVTHWPYASADLPVLADIGILGIPPYSTDIAAAWQVVEKMRDKGWVMRLVENDDDTWGVEFIAIARRLELDGHHLAEADSAEKVICIGALRAMGVEA